MLYTWSLWEYFYLLKLPTSNSNSPFLPLARYGHCHPTQSLWVWPFQITLRSELTQHLSFRDWLISLNVRACSFVLCPMTVLFLWLIASPCTLPAYGTFFFNHLYLPVITWAVLAIVNSTVMTWVWVSWIHSTLTLLDYIMTLGILPQKLRL